MPSLLKKPPESRRDRQSAEGKRISHALKTALARLLVVYALLVLPWPGSDRVVGECFRAVCGVFFHDDARRELAFITPGEGSARPLDTRIEIANRALLKPDGSGPVRDLDIDAHSFAWQPLALLIALVIATPLPWPRRARALVLGIPLLSAVILGTLGFCIWQESAEIGLVSMNAFWQGAAKVARDMISSQATRALPLIIWILVTFRSGDGWVGFAPSRGID